jgi:hypothetical protein
MAIKKKGKAKDEEVVVLATVENEQEVRDDEGEDDGQEIIEVKQSEVKQALRSLVTKENEYLAMLYTKWDEYNKQYFEGALEQPLITIEKINNRTLGSHQNKNNIGIDNHIRFNVNFVALNSVERVLETLRHEMIHQWQDEVLYKKEGVEAHEIMMPSSEGKGEEIKWLGTFEKIEQKKRIRDWHNADFKVYAQVVGIPAKGDKCYGNPAMMPEPKSYNRKFLCDCIASNGYPVSIWSTRDIYATCDVCGEKYVEQKKTIQNKKSQAIEVKMSHVERPGQDAVQDGMKEKGFAEFARFKTKGELNEFIDGAEHVISEQETGVYQKAHNSYKDGYHYWVAYNLSGELPKPKAKKPKAKHATVKPTVKDEPSEVKKPKVKPKKKDEPVDVSLVVTDDTPTKPKATTKSKAPKKAKEPKVVEAVERSHTNPQDIIDLYKETNMIKGVAEALGVTPPTIIYQIKKHSIDLEGGTFDVKESKKK